MIIILFFDFEVFKYDWLVVFLDTKTRSTSYIVNDRTAFEKFYNDHKDEIWVGYNSRGYDQWIAKGILAGFNPYDISTWIIVKDKKGHEYSKVLNNFQLLTYDCSVFGRSLKELEAFLGHDIKETSVPFDIERKLSKEELEETIDYCTHDVMETFDVFVEMKSEFESHYGLIKEFDLPITNISKTKAQISATILGATRRERNDEFDIRYPQTLDMGKYSHILHRYMEWATNEKDYETMSFEASVCGVPHTFGIGGLHGSRDNYVGDGHFIMADVGSYYPALMIEYDYLSRNVYNPKKYTQIRDDRISLKKKKDPREYPRKIVLNSTFGAQKDKYNNLYDPQNANNICIAGQLLLVDLLDKLDGKCELIQSNTDGILIKLFKPEDKGLILDICEDWSKRTRMILEYEDVTKVIQKDVNNYIIKSADGKVKRKGAYVKLLRHDSTEKNPILDNDLPIVNKAIVNYFIDGTPVEKTIMNCKELIWFQKITKVGQKYDYAWHNNKILKERVNRCFASTNQADTTLYKKHKTKSTLDKVASVPDHCFINNANIVGAGIPNNLDIKWYIDLANQRIKDFLN